MKMIAVFTTVVSFLLLLGLGHGFHQPGNFRSQDISLTAKPTTKDVGTAKNTITEESLRSAIAPSTYKVGEIKVNINAAKKRELEAIDTRIRMEAVMNVRSLQRNQGSMETVLETVPRTKELAVKVETPKMSIAKRNYGLSSGYKKGSSDMAMKTVSSKTTEANVVVCSPRPDDAVRASVDKYIPVNTLATREKMMPLMVNLAVSEDTAFKAKQTIALFAQGQTAITTLESQLLSVQHEKQLRQVASGLGAYAVTLMAMSGDGLQEGSDGMTAVFMGLLVWGASAVGNTVPTSSVSDSTRRFYQMSSILSVFLTHAIGVPTLKMCQSLSHSVERSLMDTKQSIIQETDRKLQESVKHVLALPTTWQQKAIAKMDETVQNTLHTITTLPTKAPQVMQQAIVESMPVRLGRAMFKCLMNDVKGLLGKQ